MRHLAGVVLVSGLLPATAASCGDDGGVEATGRLTVTLTMSGSYLDTDGCTVSVDGEMSRTIEPGGSATFYNLDVGDHRVLLYDLANNCAVGTGGNPRDVTVRAGQTAETRFDVTCVALNGTLEVTTVTAGDTLDPDGYALFVDGVESQIGRNATRTFPDLTPGWHTLALGDVAVNCEATANPRVVSIGPMATQQTIFDVSCAAALFDRIAFSSNRYGDMNILVMNVDGSNQLRVTDWEGWADVYPAWSPDGTRIAFSRYGHGFYHLWVMDADGSNQVNLTPDVVVGWNTLPDWSPDGTRIAFDSNRDGNNEIYVMDADGSNLVRLTNDPAYDRSPTWSPDGTRIAFVSDRDGNAEIYVMNADGSNPLRLTNHPAGEAMPHWSPDGTRIAFETDRDGNWEIYVMDAAGGNPVNLTNDLAIDCCAAWSPDGTRIAFQSGRDGKDDIYLMNTDGSNPVRLTFDPEYDWKPAWSPGSHQR